MYQIAINSIYFREKAIVIFSPDKKNIDLYQQILWNTSLFGQSFTIERIRYHGKNQDVIYEVYVFIFETAYAMLRFISFSTNAIMKKANL